MTARIQRIGKSPVWLAAVTRLAAGVLALGLLFLLLFPGAAPAQTTLQLLQPVKGTPVAKDFALPDLDGKTVRLKDLRGRVVLVNFWATWCPPCRFEIPALQRAWLKLKDQGVVLLAVHLGGDADEVWSFAEKYGVTFPILMDSGASVGRSWGMRGLPTTYVIDPQGRMVYRAIGAREWDDPAILRAILELRK